MREPEGGLHSMLPEGHAEIKCWVIIAPMWPSALLRLAGTVSSDDGATFIQAGYWESLGRLVRAVRRRPGPVPGTARIECSGAFAHVAGQHDQQHSGSGRFGGGAIAGRGGRQLGHAPIECRQYETTDHGRNQGK